MKRSSGITCNACQLVSQCTFEDPTVKHTRLPSVSRDAGISAQWAPSAHSPTTTSDSGRVSNTGMVIMFLMTCYACDVTPMFSTDQHVCLMRYSPVQVSLLVTSYMTYVTCATLYVSHVLHCKCYMSYIYKIKRPETTQSCNVCIPMVDTYTSQEHTEVSLMLAV